MTKIASLEQNSIEDKAKIQAFNEKISTLEGQNDSLNGTVSKLNQ